MCSEKAPASAFDAGAEALRSRKLKQTKTQMKSLKNELINTDKFRDNGKVAIYVYDNCETYISWSMEEDLVATLNEGQWEHTWTTGALGRQLTLHRDYGSHNDSVQFIGCWDFDSIIKTHCAPIRSEAAL